MGRLLLILAIVIAVVWLLRRALAGPRKQASGESPGAAGGDLVSCAHCGVNLPKTEARSAGGRYYCSEEHWRAGPREG
ncbi:MAG: hypothetical protein IT513_03895 [Burkholderiales bacterium]|nr:hypothetical protein [Burkholderiales bacterium]